MDLEAGVVSPGGIGYDVNCGVRLLRTSLTPEDLKPRLKQLINTLYENVPCGVGEQGRLKLNRQELGEVAVEGVNYAIEKGHGVPADAEHCEENGRYPGADYSKVSDRAKQRGAPQCGTLGSGNHFLELQKVDRVLDEATARAFGLSEGQVTVMVHCGSRGYGHQICDDYVRRMLPVAESKYGLRLADKELAAAPLDSPEARDYLAAMATGINYAFYNRQMITHWIRESFAQAFARPWEDFGLEMVYDVCHNIGKFEEHEVDGKNRKVFIHRKGATRALWKGRPEVPQGYRSVGQPVLIPGSMETASYVLVGLPGAKETFGSSTHGAGRVMSRHEALRRFRGQELQKKMEAGGMAVKAPTPQSLAEEAGAAYKDVDAVVKSVEAAGVTRIVARLTPLGVIKG
jgi:tRNA-splicing ligase RtcB